MKNVANGMVKILASRVVELNAEITRLQTLVSNLQNEIKQIRLDEYNAVQYQDKMKTKNNMITYYTHDDLASFGAYMVSPERTERIKAAYKEGDNWTLEERLANIYQLDVDTWLDVRKNVLPEQIVGPISLNPRAHIPQDYDGTTAP